MPTDSSDLFDELLIEAVHEPALLIPGTELASGRFVVRALLGRGGMGAVYRATDTRRRCDVAIKVLSRVEPAGIYALKREFRSLANIHHPNLVALHELFVDRATWFLTMDLVEGTPLSQVAWTIPLVRDVFDQIAEAMRTIHGQGKLHRDLKPSNVMVTPTGRVVVLDFGLVSDLEPRDARRTLTNDGLSGTPAYMAPEQATGQATLESDWYAFGTMLYEALYSILPFPETGVAALVRKREEPATPPPSAGIDVPTELEELCLRLLDRDAAHRPGHDEIVAALGAPRVAASAGEDPAPAPFVGRAAELHALERALLETDRGRSAVVTVTGDAGIGKTRLVTQFLERVGGESSCVAVTGRCPRWEHVPFRACDSMVDDLSRYLRSLPTERAVSMLPRSVHALCHVFPVLDRLPAVRAIKQRRALPREPAEIRRLGLEALRELVGNIAAQERLVVFIDDLQWSDLDGARVLASLVAQTTQPDAPALLLVVAYRTQEERDAPGLAAFLERVTKSTGLRIVSLPLPELSADESRLLAERLLDRPRGLIADRIARDSGGNPLFLHQLARHVDETGANEGPLDLENILARRVAELAPRERDALAAVCLTTRPLSLDMLARITGHPDPEPPIRALVAAHLARFASGPVDKVYAFHDRVREVVLSTMDGLERERLHARAVEAHEAAAEPDLGALTLHYLGCGREADAAACAVQAARRAASSLAFEQSAALYRLALGLGRWESPERIDLLVRLAAALALDRRTGEAAAQLLRAASLEADAARRRDLRIRAADHYLASGWLVEGIGLLRGVFAEVGLDYDAIASADVVELRARLAARGLRLEPRPEREIPAETLARLDALLVAGNGLAWLKPESVQFRFALALEALDAGDPLRAASGLRTVARFDTQLDPDDVAVYEVVRRLCDEHPGPQVELLRPDLETAMAFVRGRPWDQLEAARRSEELLLQQPTPKARLLDVARFHQGLALFVEGDVVGLDPCWGWLEDAEERRDVFLGAWLNVILASQQLAHGRLDAAREMCGRATRTWAAVEEMRESAMSLCLADVLSACDAYEGDAAAWDRLRDATVWFERSSLSLPPFMSCYRHCTSAQRALACAGMAGPGSPRREALLRAAEEGAERAAHPRGLDGRTFVLPHWRTMATLLFAGLAAARGDAGAALDHLDHALERLRAVGTYGVLAAHARRARGLVLGGDEGGALIEQAEADLRRLGVRHPAQHAVAVLPGFPS